MVDKRVKRTREALKEALLEALKSTRLSQITVSSLAAMAGVSRSTFYANFQNVNDIFEMLIVDFMQETRALKLQLRCRGCEGEAADGKMPYCQAVRSTERYHSLVREAEFLPSLLRLINDEVIGIFALEPYLSLDVSSDEAKALLVFQMAGCHTAALSGLDDTEWLKVQPTLDAFISGGMKAVKSEMRGRP